MLRQAHEGAGPFLWLHDLVQRAGYTKYSKPGVVLLVTAKTLEKLLGCSTRHVRDLVAEGLPCAEPGVGARPSLFDAAAVLEWVRRRDAAKAPDVNEGSAKALAEYRVENARAAKRENDLAEGRLVLADDVRQQLSFIGAALRTELEGVGRSQGEAYVRDLLVAVERAEVRWKEIFLPHGGPA